MLEEGPRDSAVDHYQSGKNRWCTMQLILYSIYIFHEVYRTKRIQYSSEVHDYSADDSVFQENHFIQLLTGNISTDGYGGNLE